MDLGLNLNFIAEYLQMQSNLDHATTSNSHLQNKNTKEKIQS